MSTPPQGPGTDKAPLQGDELQAYLAKSARYTSVIYDNVPQKPQGPRTRWEIWIAGVVVIGAIGWFASASLRNHGESIRRIRHYPDQFTGRDIQVRGRVGDVFAVGNSYAFYLLQDRDTIVVFTRGERPQEQRVLNVRGSISIGYLDGIARPALFAREAS